MERILNKIELKGSLSLKNAEGIYAGIEKFLYRKDLHELEISLLHLTSIDSAGIALLLELKKQARQLGKKLYIKNIPLSIRQSLRIFLSRKAVPTQSEQSERNFFYHLGNLLINFQEGFMDFLYHSVDTIFAAVRGLRSGKLRRQGSITEQTILIGMNAFPIIALMSFLIGLVLALQSAAQLRQFGANIFVADLIAISMTREMGPLMTAIILAGRSGSSFASEIATMKVSEELDALRVMGLNPLDYVVVPKFYAILLSAPLLTILADIIGILGGFIIASLYLDLTPVVFFNEVLKVLFLKDIITSLIKSMVFAWLVVSLGSYYGLQASGGPAGVGRMTTKSVVSSIFMVIVFDSILGILFYF